MSEGGATLGETASASLTDVLGLVPYVWPLTEAIGLFGLEPRLREMVVLSVLEGRGCPACEAVHRSIGRLAGLTELEIDGDRTALTAAEQAALVLALGTVSRLPDELEADDADEHFTSGQIRQIQAVALAADAACNLGRTMSSFAPIRIRCS